MKIQNYFLPIFLLLNTFLAFSQTEIAYINDSWKFIKEDNSSAANVDFDDKSWQKVNLPHTWNSMDAYISKQYYRGIGWYRKELNLTNKYEGKQLFINFEGAFYKRMCI